MPPKAEITKEKVLAAAFDMVREHGMDILTARSIAQRLKCSTQPIYSVYGNMDQLKEDVFNKAIDFSIFCMKQYTDTDNSPAMQLAIGSLLFAQNEKQLFRTVFLSDYRKLHMSKRGNTDKILEEMYAAFLRLDNRLTTIPENEIRKMYMKLSTYVLGIGTMINTEMLRLDIKEAVSMIEEMYRFVSAKEGLA